MNTSENKKRIKRVILFGFVYLLIGVATAVISNPLSSSGMQVAWRLGAFVISIVVFAVHIRLENIRLLNSPFNTAINTSGAVAAGTFAIAVLANINALITETGNNNSLAFALLIWPIVTGLLSFLAAYVAAKLITRMRSRS